MTKTLNRGNFYFFNHDPLKLDDTKNLTIPTQVYSNNKTDVNYYVSRQLGKNGKPEADEFAKFRDKLPSGSLFVDVDSNDEYNGFGGKFLTYKDTKQKTFKYKYKDNNGNDKEAEYNLFKLEKDENGTKKVLYAIKAEGIHDNIENVDKFLAFSQHLQERHLNKGKYKNVVFNCASGISRSVTLAAIASVCDAKVLNDKAKKLDVIKDVISKRHNKLESGKYNPIKDGKLFVKAFQNNSIINGFNGYDGMDDYKKNAEITEANQANYQKYIDAYVKFQNKFDALIDKKIDSADLVDRYKKDFLSKTDKTFEERKGALNKISNENKDLNTTLNRLHKDTWFEGFEQSLKDLPEEQLKKMSTALSSNKDLNDIFKSSRLSALKEVGEEEQLKRLKERAKKAVEAKLTVEF